MPLTGPHLIQGGRAVPLTGAQFAAMRRGHPVAVAEPRRAPAAAAAAAASKPPAFDGAAYGRKDMLARHGMKEPAVPKADAADRLAALPKTLAEARGDARAYSKADMKRQAAAAAGGAAPSSAGASASRASMVAELRRQGMEPTR